MATVVIFASDGSILQTARYDDAMIDAVLPYLLIGRPVGTEVIQIATSPIPVALLSSLAYVDGGVVRSRVSIDAVVSTYDIAADGVAEAEITGLPIPCTVVIGGALSVEPFELGDGVLVITSDVVGDIVVSVTAAPPWLAWTATLHAS